MTLHPDLANHPQPKFNTKITELLFFLQNHGAGTTEVQPSTQGQAQ